MLALRELRLEPVDVDQLLAGAGLARRHRWRPPQALLGEIRVDLVVATHRAAIARVGAARCSRRASCASSTSTSTSCSPGAGLAGRYRRRPPQALQGEFCIDLVVAGHASRAGPFGSKLTGVHSSE